MINIAIDLGSYSVKFLQFDHSKNGPIFLSAKEVKVDHALINEDKSLWNVQYDLILDYLEQCSGQVQFYITLPSELVTTRYITLPIANKKKALQMLPFQIEEDLPSSITDSHYDHLLEVKEADTLAIVGIVKKNDFLDYFRTLERATTAPSILTASICSYSYYVELNQIDYPQAFAIIDIGHQTTKAYFYLNQKLVANNFSYIAGKEITNAISKNYNIDFDEAALYKHQNSFFLRKNQLNEVNDKQKAFAQIMDSTIEPLINDIKRWLIGFRVHHGFTLDKVYLTGGTANIKNIGPYLESELGISTEILDTMEYCNTKAIESDLKHIAKFNGASALTYAPKKKSKFFNFLKGEYSLANSQALPLESYTIWASRVAILSLLLTVHFGIQAFFVNSENDKLSRTITKKLKSDYLGLSTSRDRLLMKVAPERMLTKLEKRQKSVIQEVSMIQSSTEVNALDSLQNIFPYLQGQNVEILLFTSTHGQEYSFELKAENSSILLEVDKNLKRNLKNIHTKLNEKKNTLTVNGEL